MSDDDVARLLRSDAPLVVIEAPAGCGKTYQGASYANDALASLSRGRLLILAHTHAACGVFADRTQDAGARVEIRTIASLTVEIASAYHGALAIPPNPEKWAWKNNGAGFEEIATKVAEFLIRHPMITQALARRYPIIICDEFQDCTADQHSIVMSLHSGGSIVRIFGDPLQRIYTGKTKKSAAADAQRWDGLKKSAAFAVLDYPHRWANGSLELGKWILSARQALLDGQPIDLTGMLPASLTILEADNQARVRTQYQLNRQEGDSVRNAMLGGSQMMVLAINNERVQALSAFCNRRVRVWEGHTRETLATLVESVTAGHGNPEMIGSALVRFVGSISVGFSPSSHGDRLMQEIREGCSRSTTGKPACLQAMAKKIVDDADHIGLAAALRLLAGYISTREIGFTDVKIDHKTEFAEAIQLGSFPAPEEGFAELARRRTHFRRSPPPRALTTIHKAKGLECANAMVAPCDGAFSDSYYSKCRLYVALSRASQSLTLVIPRNGPSSLLKMA